MNQQVSDKLRDTIYPYIITADELRFWWPLVIYEFYAYTSELFVLIAGLGLHNPVVSWLNGGTSPNIGTTTAATPQKSVLEFLGSDYFALIALVILCGWGLFKFFISREQLEKKCNLLKSFIKQCEQLSVAVENCLGQSDPMPELVAIHKKLSDGVSQNKSEGAWPSFIFKPGIDARVNELCNLAEARYGSQWEPPPPGKF